MELNEDWWTTGSWTCKLYNVLRPAPPDSVTPQLAKSFSRFRHSPGDIWKHTFSNAIYHDLSGVALEHDSMGAVTWRRFVRVEHIGLSGIIFYQLLAPSSKQALETHADGDVSYYLNLENVFGDLDNPSDSGMGLDELLDTVDAKMVYFPAYACTSFFIGQVMYAFLHDQPRYRPQPAYRGFSVCLGQSNIASQPLSPCDMDTPAKIDIELAEPSSPKSALGQQLRSFGKDLTNALSSEVASPYASLRIRSSSLCTSDSSGTQGETESVTSTIDSSGPLTPPSSARSSQSQIKTTQSLYDYNALLSFLDLSLDEYED
ncbi:hypothetical protein BJ912DRAFT_480657 [Pholiota molesta]|nr:hypothetical protein BJ912DRAFT_480657 [Pholiota molesta]